MAMARKKKGSEVERERREIRRIFNDRAIVPDRVARFAIRTFGDMAEAFPTRKDGVYWCDHCGERFTFEIVKTKRDADTVKGICPHCGAKVTIHADGLVKNRGYAYNYEERIVRPRVHRTDHYIKELTTYKGWQVIKEYFASKHARIGEKPRYGITLVYSIWMNPASGRTHIFALRTLGLGMWYCRTPFALSSNYYFTKSTTQNSLYNGWRDSTLCHSVLPYFRQRGCEPKGDEELVFPAYIEAGTQIETLTKLGYKEGAAQILDSPRYRKTAVECWRGIVLAFRHGYGPKIKELGWGLYLDYLKELKELRLDWHSPHYLCPADFHAAHAETARRLTKKMKERAERMAEGRQRAALERDVRERERREKATAAFEKRIVKFLPLAIIGDGLVIRPLATVSDFKDEGDAMHHCVYSNGYYMRPESLILSARTDEGRRVETVEVSLDKYCIVQSRAVCNGMSDRHDDILALVNRAMPEIRRLANKKRMLNKLSA